MAGVHTGQAQLLRGSLLLRGSQLIRVAVALSTERSGRRLTLRLVERTATGVLESSELRMLLQALHHFFFEQNLFEKIKLWIEFD